METDFAHAVVEMRVLKEALEVTCTLAVNVRNHKFFERDEDDLFHEIMIPFTLATLGGTVQAPTLDGKVSLKFPREHLAIKLSESKTRVCRTCECHQEKVISTLELS